MKTALLIAAVPCAVICGVAIFAVRITRDLNRESSKSLHPSSQPALPVPPLPDLTVYVLRPVKRARFYKPSPEFVSGVEAAALENGSLESAVDYWSGE